MHRAWIAVAWFAGESLNCASNPLSGAALNEEFESIVAGRAAIEFPCAEPEVSVQDLGGRIPTGVTGCGEYATYECDYDDSQGNSSDKNYWIYTCDRAAQDNPQKLDAGLQ